MINFFKNKNKENIGTSENSKNKILVSGVKPTGQPHIGNYFGAMKQFVDLQDKYDSNIFIADLHAMTSVQNRAEMEKNILNVAMDYLAIGIDPKKVTIFKQSDLVAIPELAWIFSCITTMPYLMRAHAFKDAEAKNKEINTGVFNYPILMAADILIQNADIVPVGRDQKQHVEIARDTAEKFNRIYGETFKLPEPLILQEVETVPGIDGQKMSKSYKNTISLFATTDEIRKSVMSIATDSRGQNEPKDTNSTLFNIHKLFLDENGRKNLTDLYNSGISYKEAKEKLISDIDNFISPMRKNRQKWQNNPDAVKKILKQGAEKAFSKTKKITSEFREKVGISL